jgi:subtilisin family serine protease
MRRALLMVLLLFFPVVNAYVAPVDLAEEAMNAGSGEVLLELGEGVWTSSEWVRVSENGLVPLRIVSSTQLIAWGQKGLDSNIHDVHPSPEAIWKSGLDGLNPIGGGLVRVLLEPRLPPSAFAQVQRELNLFGIQLPDGHETSPLAASHEVPWPNGVGVSDVLAVEGLLWIEPVLETQARNSQAAALMQDGRSTGHPAWELGINGAGVIVAAADSGLDADHACFRNASVAGALGSSGPNGTELVGAPGEAHRKMALTNTSIDGGDTQGHSDYRHGTHVAGTLACYNVDDERSGAYPSNGSSLSHGSRLIFQDIVSEDGWVPPDVDELLVEAGMNGAVIHSNSWGDDTTAYTARTSDFDAWALAMPWSLSFIAPGNTGSELMEPANGRNIAAIGASVKSQDTQRWSASSIGPTEAGTNGIFALAVGTSVQSAKADNMADSYNGDLRGSSGTSMATPGAAGVAALIQQLVEMGWISGQGVHTNTSGDSIPPLWSDLNLSNSTVKTGEGFTPSGPMLRALLALATTQLPSDERNGGNGGGELQNPYDGWGQLNLSALLDLAEVQEHLVEGYAAPASDVWIHDSFRLIDGNPTDWLRGRQGNSTPLENLINNPWNGSGAAGPFLQTGDAWIQRFSHIEGVDFSARLAHIAAPEPTAVNDLQLVAHLSDGRIAVDGVFSADGYSTLHYSSVDLDNETTFPVRNETTLGLRLSAEDLAGIDWVELEVRARFVAPGNIIDGVGLDGTHTGFSLAVKGVHRDAQDWGDLDNDGVVNIEDLCPNQDASGWDLDQDGCLDDDDSDGITDNLDACPGEDARMYDSDSDGCIDDGDEDGVLDNLDACLTSVADADWPVGPDGCRPVDHRPVVAIVKSPATGFIWDGALLVNWTVHDEDGDPYKTGAEIHVIDNRSDGGGYIVASCMRTSNLSASFQCVWNAEVDLPVWNLEGAWMRLDVHVQSANASPEADNDRIIVQSSELFQGQRIGSFTPDGPLTVDDGENVVISPLRTMFWGVLGVIGVGLLVYRIGMQSFQQEPTGSLPSPFVEPDVERENSLEQEMT